MTILVTGGCGFIGSNFIHEHFSSSNETIINLDKLTYAGNLENLKIFQASNNYHFYEGCISDKELLLNIFRKFEPRFVINFAAETHVDRSINSGEPFLQTNILGTWQLLEATLKIWKEQKSKFCKEFRFIHVSTDEVYGTLELDEPAFTEKSQYKPNSPYSASKAASDHLVRSFNKTYGLPTIITNCSNNYGPRQFPEKLIPLVIKKCIISEEIPVYGDGRQIRDWIHVNDHCKALIAILKNGQVGEVYNIGGDCEIENISLVAMICEIMDDLRPLKNFKSYSDQIRFVTDRLGHDRRYAVNSAKIYNQTGWKTSTNLEHGLRETIKWYLNNLNWLNNIKSDAN